MGQYTQAWQHGITDEGEKKEKMMDAFSTRVPPSPSPGRKNVGTWWTLNLPEDI